ncbi:MAG: microcompartment protein [Clostridia bacterium]|jgi:microcompartment protein CcmL/EutN|nr:microcompartment protein [Clostridia bacterium]
MNRYHTYGLGAIGVVEVNFYTTAVVILDEMLKSSEVTLVSCEKKLGGRLVSMIVAGDISSVNTAIETAKGLGKTLGEKNIKVAVMISNPHPEIIKLLNLIKQPISAVAKQDSEKVDEVSENIKPNIRRKSNESSRND